MLILYDFVKLPQSFFLLKNDSPLKDGAEAQIEFDIDCGQGLPLSLRYSINFILLCFRI